MVRLSIRDKVIAYSALYFLIAENKPVTIDSLRKDTLLDRLGTYLPANSIIGTFLTRSHAFVRTRLSKLHPTPMGDAAAVYHLEAKVYSNLLRHKNAIIRRANSPVDLAELIFKYASTP